MNLSHMSDVELGVYVEGRALFKLERELYLRWSATQEERDELRVEVAALKKKLAEVAS